MKKKILSICKVTLSALMCLALLSGCGEKKTKLKYGDTKGVVSGSVIFSEEGAELKLENVMADLNSDIDYTSGIEVQGEGDYSLDVNASNVKYDTPGTYTATYTLKSGDNTYSKNVKVTINKSGGERADDSGDNYVNNSSGDGIQTGDQGSTGGDNTGAQINNSNQGDGGNASGDGVNASGNSGNASGNSGNASGNSGNASGNSGTASDNTPTAPKELITEKGGVTYKNVSIGNSSIELLSGNVVTIKCSTNNYIVETKTVESEVTKSGHKYKVTKLVVVFNTGKEQTVETIEKRID